MLPILTCYFSHPKHTCVRIEAFEYIWGGYNTIMAEILDIQRYNKILLRNPLQKNFRGREEH